MPHHPQSSHLHSSHHCHVLISAFLIITTPYLDSFITTRIITPAPISVFPSHIITFITAFLFSSAPHFPCSLPHYHHLNHHTSLNKRLITYHHHLQFFITTTLFFSPPSAACPKFSFSHHHNALANIITSHLLSSPFPSSLFFISIITTSFLPLNITLYPFL